jgi:unsaturated pyranuronate lyase
VSELRVVRAAELPTFPLAEGIDVHPIAGTDLNINVVVLTPGAVASPHAHVEEQIGYVVSGSCVFTDGSRTWDLGPGDVYHAPPGAPHGATANGEGCVIIDAFSPPKAEILTLLRALGPG